MPQVIEVVAALIVSSLGGAALGEAGFAFAVYALEAGIYVGLAFAARELFKPPTPRLSDRGSMLRAPAQPRQIVYGRARVSGPLCFIHTTGTTNKYLHLVIPLASHECEAIDEIWVDGERVYLDIRGATSGRYSRTVTTIRTNLKFLNHVPDAGGSLYQAAINNRVFQITTTGDEYAARDALFAAITGHERYPYENYTATKIDHGGFPWIFFESKDKGGSIYFNYTYPNLFSTDPNTNLTPVIYPLLPAGEVVSWAAGLPEPYAARGPYGGGIGYESQLTRLYIRAHLGSPDQTVEPWMLNDYGFLTYREGSSCPDLWTTAHRLRGICYLYVRMEYDTEVFAGVPNISAVVRGRKVYDPRDGTQDANNPDTWKYSDNAALCLLDYTRGVPRRIGDGTLSRALGINASDDEIDLTLAAAAANVCDESVSLAAGGSEKRYTVNGPVSTENRPGDNVAALVQAMAGEFAWSGGKFRIMAGAYRTPTLELGLGDIFGPLDVVNRLSRRDVFNAVKGVFVDPEKNWQPTDFPPVTNATYLAADGGERVWHEAQFDFTTSAAACQRIGKILLEKTRQEIFVTLRCSLKALELRATDTVMLTVPRFGWTQKVFDVVSWSFAPVKVDNAEALGIELALRETAAAVYDWNSGEETTIDPAPDTLLPTPFDLAAPGIPTVTEELYETATGVGTRSKAVVAWASGDAFAAVYELQYRPHTAGDSGSEDGWIVAARTPDLSFDLHDLAPGYYDFRVKAQNTLGFSSGFATREAVEIFGLTAKPSAPTNVSLEVRGDEGILKWDPTPDLDVRIGGHFVFRHQPATTGVTWNTAVPIGGRAPGAATEWALPLRTGTYLVKAVDSTGNESSSASAVITTLPDVIHLNVVATQTEHPSFPGTHSFTYADSGKLRLSGAALWDSYPGNIDDWGLLDTLGGVASSGTYTFPSSSTAVDLGAVFTSRLTASLKATGVNVLDTVDARTALMDDWPDFDGAEPTDVSAVLYIRTTSDDPAGSPTWSAWQPFTVGDYVARAFQFQLRLSSADQDHNIEVSELAVTIDMPDRMERGVNVTVPAAGLAVTFTDPFQAEPSVGVTGQNLASSDRWAITAKTRTGFTVRFFDSGGSGVQRLCDWQAVGHGREV